MLCFQELAVMQHSPVCYHRRESPGVMKKTDYSQLCCTNSDIIQLIILWCIFLTFLTQGRNNIYTHKHTQVLISDSPFLSCKKFPVFLLDLLLQALSPLWLHVQQWPSPLHRPTGKHAPDSQVFHPDAFTHSTLKDSVMLHEQVWIFETENVPDNEGMRWRRPQNHVVSLYCAN